MAVDRNTPNNTPIGITRSNGGASIDKKIDLLNQKLDGLYKDIYTSRPDNRENLDSIIDNLDDMIDRLQGADITTSGMSELLRRIDKGNDTNTKKMISSVQDLFENQNLVSSLIIDNNSYKYIAAENANYDLICKYLPKLEEALEIKRDNVLCSDNFSKSYLNPVSRKSSKEEVALFNVNVNKIEQEYDISEFLDKTYMNTSKYGEDFIYIVPYNVAFARLFRKSNYRMNSARVGQAVVFESYNGGKQQVLQNGFNATENFKKYIRDVVVEKSDDVLKNIPDMGSVTLHFNTSNMIQSVVGEHCVLRDKSDLEEFASLSESYFGSIDESKDSENMTNMFSNFGSPNSSKKKTHNFFKDGLILNDNLDRDPDKLDKDFLGAVVERIPRECIVPVYIGKKCFGYYYFEFAENPTACGFCGGHHSNTMLGNGYKTQYDMSEQQQELAMRYIASRISSAIDTKFINSNKDLKEEIYAVLNYNEKFDISRSNDIGVTFIPAEDMIHTYFEINDYTHRGISDLARSVTPAMLYILLYLTDIIGKVTRATDKRVYYVKQNVETNVARTMMNVVQQIKKGNMGMRQIESINNILNIVGKYNDFIIPMGPSGDPPVSFEIMQGQDINTPTDIMEKMEEAAVSQIIPFEFVNSTYQQDFATRFTMSNTRFLKTVYTRQRKTERFFSKIYTKIYNYEFRTNIPYIQIILPPPTYLVNNNNAQLIDNVSQMADKIIETEMTEEDDLVKQEWKRLYVRDSLSTYIDFDRVEQLKEQAKFNVEINKPAGTEDGEISGIADDDDF